MNRFIRKIELTLLSILMLSSASAATTGRGGIYFGSKSLDHHDWGDLDTQATWGIHLDVKEESWPVWATMGYVSSQDEQSVITSVTPLAITKVEGKTSEIHLGAKKDFFPLKKLQLSFSGGPAYIRGSLDQHIAPFQSDSDSAVGVWAGADALVFLGVFVVGVSYQYSQADIDLFSRSVNAGGKSLSFSVGFGW